MNKWNKLNIATPRLLSGGTIPIVFGTQGCYKAIDNKIL